MTAKEYPALNQADHLYDLLLRAAAPMTVAPLGATPDTPRLRGVVRAGDRARIAVASGADLRAAVAFEFPLADPRLDITGCLDWLRRTADRSRLDALAATGSRRDSHDNHVIAAADAGWDTALLGSEPDHNYFTLLSLLLFGGGALWFEDVYALAGYMLTTAGRHRLYLTDHAHGDVLGIDLPLTAADGRVEPGFAGSLPQELASIIESGHLRALPVMPVVDDYCQCVYDLSAWVDPSGAR